MPKRGVLSSSFEGLASLEAKRQRQSEERQNRYLAREKHKATGLRVRVIAGVAPQCGAGWVENL